MRLRYSPRAAQDLLEISAYLRAHNPAASAQVGSEIRQHLGMLADHPHAGRPIGTELRRSPVPRRPYIVIYRPDDATNELIVITIRHTSRRPLA